MLGAPVVRSLAERGHRVRALTRSVERTRKMFGGSVEIVAGRATDREDIRSAIAGCDSVHISLPHESELVVVQHVIHLAPAERLERISYVSATTACEANRWFELIDVKMRAEDSLRHSGIPHTVFCPTWAMETLPNFVHGNRAVAILGKNPPKLHFFAAAELGQIVAASYDDDRSLGKRLFIHGPHGFTLHDAVERFIKACRPGLKLMRMRLWQARLFARLTRRHRMSGVVRLISYFDRVGELGDPTEANTLFGAPSITLDEWLESLARTEV